MGRPRARTVVLDAGALIALEKRDRKMEALLRLAHRVQAPIVIPAGVLAQVWTGDAEQAPLHRLLRRHTTEVVALDRVLAEGVGRLCKRAGTSDVVDASVVIAARQANAVVLTSDPADLKRLDPRLPVERV
jgi:predicted nucleic acid-binding protein